MNKYRLLLCSSMLALTLTPMTGFAETIETPFVEDGGGLDYTLDVGSLTTDIPDTSYEILSEMATSNTFHIDISYTGSQDYVPTLTFTFENKRTKEKQDVIVNKTMFNVEKSAFEVVLDKFSIQTNDKIGVTFTGSSSTIESIFAQDKSENISFQKNKETILGLEYVREDGDKFLEGSKDFPLVIYTTHVKNTFVYTVLDKDGKPITETPVIVYVGDSKKPYNYTTNSDGQLVLDKSKITPFFKIEVGGKGVAIVDLPPNSFTDDDMDYIHEETIELTPRADDAIKDDMEKEKETAKEYEVELGTDFDTRLSDKWLQVVVELESGRKIKLNLKSNKIKIPVGDKIKTITSDTAKVINYNLTEDGKLKIKLEPKYTFTLHNGGNPYDVTFLNKKGLNLKGSDKLVFGISPNEVIQTKDNKKGKTYTFSSGKKAEGNKIEFNVDKGKDGTGTKSTKITNPHTNDIILILLVSVFLLLIILGVLLIIKKKTKGVNTLLVFILVGSTISTGFTNKVSANSNVGGSDGGSNADAGLAGTMLQMVEYIAVYEVYFVEYDSKDAKSKANDYIDKSGNIRFDKSSRSASFYFAPDALSYNSLIFPGSGVVEYDDNVGSHQSSTSVHNLKVLSGTNAIETYLGSNLVIDSTPSTPENIRKRAISTASGIPGKEETGAGAYFMNTLSGVMQHAYNRSDITQISPLSGLYNTKTPAHYKQPFGEAAAQQFNSLLSKLDDEKHKENRIKLVESYLDLVKAKGIVKDFSNYQKSIMKALEKGTLTMQINTLVGITQYKSSGNKPHGQKPYAFMSVHDASTWYYYMMLMIRGSGRVGTLNTLHEKYTSQVGQPAESALYRKWGRIGWTFNEFLMNAYTITAQPKGDEGKYPTLTLSQAKGSAKSTNPFGGWFFQVFAPTENSAKPEIYVTIELKVKDADGKYTGEVKKIEIPNWARSKNIKLEDLKDDKVSVNSSFEIDGDLYNVDPSANVEITAKDEVFVNDKQVDLSSLTPPVTQEDFIAKDLTALGSGDDKRSTQLSAGAVYLAQHLPNFKYTSYYLGGIATEDFKEKDGTLKAINKYYGAKHNGAPVNGDMHVHLIVDAEKVDLKQKGEHTVPQWSLAEVELDDYKKRNLEVTTIFNLSAVEQIKPDTEDVPPWSYLSTYENTVKLYADIIGVKTGKGGTKKETLNPSLGIPLYMDYTQPLIDEKVSWYQPKVEYNEVKLPKKDFTYLEENLVHGKYTPVQPKRYVTDFGILNGMAYTTPLNMSLRLIRSYLDLDIEDYVRLNGEGSLGSNTSGAVKGVDSRYKVKFVDSDYEYFYNPSSYEVSDKIVKEDKIKREGKVFLSHRVGVEKWDYRDGYRYQTLVNQRLTYTNKYYQIVCGYYSCWTIYTDMNRERTLNDKNLPFESFKVDIDFKVTYDKYVAKKQEGMTKQHTTFKNADKFSSWKIEDDKRKFKFFPETTMYNELDVDFTTEEYDYSIDVILGEEERKLNTHFLVLSELVPKDDTGQVKLKASVNGSSATATSAQALAQSLNKGVNTPVLPKGSSTVNSLGFENAQIDVKMYFIDIKDDVVKSTFNPDSDSWETTEEIANKYLSELKNDKGEIKGKARGYYFVGDNEYEPVLKDIGFRQDSEPKATEFELEVRGGELTKVIEKDINGIKEQVKTIYGEDDLDACANKKVYKREQDIDLGCATTLLTMFDDNKGLFSVLEKKKGDKVKKGWEDYVKGANDLRNLDASHDKAVKMGKEWYFEDTTIFIVRELHYKFNIPTYMWTAQLPMNFEGLGIETPVDKSSYYSKGQPSYIGTEFTFGEEDKFMFTFNINPKDIEDNDYDLLVHDKGHQYIVPNVSILDALQ